MNMISEAGTAKALQQRKKGSARAAPGAGVLAHQSRGTHFPGSSALGLSCPFCGCWPATASKPSFASLWQQLVVPLLGIAIFLIIWGVLAPQVHTSLGAIPGPAQVASAAQELWQDHLAERSKAAAFYDRQAARNQKLTRATRMTQNRRPYNGRPTYADQIVTSLETVFAGFCSRRCSRCRSACCAACPQTVNAAVNPLVQIFKPVSPLAWLPIVTMVVSALFTSRRAGPAKIACRSRRSR